VSRQDKLNPPKIENGLSETPLDDDRRQINLRIRLDEVAAAKGEQLRASSRRRPSKKELLRLACKLYDARRGRDRMFTDGLFGEPAWDMLLGLYCLPSRGVILGVTSLGHAANIAPTTGLRWQEILSEHGLIERGPPVRDSRRHLVRLTRKGRILMEKYLMRLFYCDCPDHGHKANHGRLK
jgi:DNA-binding MarR family transcriptional regulator